MSLIVEHIRRAELTDGETSMTAANDLAVVACCAATTPA
jgi:hypothetical protein